ncbi:hypothetical protein V6N13_148503 [Hibiscus sabdariffa]
MARCKNAPETSGRTTPPVQIRYFENDDAKARHQTLKGRQTLGEKGFVFKGKSKESFPPSVMATIAMHKWEKFVTHPGSVDPNQKPINVTLVQEFYAHLTSPTQSSVYVRGEHIQFTATKINKFYGLQNTADNHSKFVHRCWKDHCGRGIRLSNQKIKSAPFPASNYGPVQKEGSV